MERVLQNYDFLIALAKSSGRKQNKLLDDATPEQILSVIDCVSLYTKQKAKVPELNILRGAKRWKRAVVILKKNRKLVPPVIASVISALIREALHYLYNME